jgi:hypothetical protein
MGKKMYEAVAAIIRNARTKGDLRDRLADYFESQNPAFDRIRFIEACEKKKLIKV